MDYLWTPWRYQYMEQVTAGQQPDCVFCDALARNDDENTLIAYRGAKTFVILNRFPYTSGHVMIVPYAHGGDFATVAPRTLAEMMSITQRVQAALATVYKPQGFNLGMNLGHCAGAGITDHVHMHLLPRWIGDANFMSTIAETRMEPEDLDTTYKKLREALGVK
jgi:ATP adenylyltransferase